jgi:hypothetical protein
VRRSTLMLALILAALWAAPVFAQGPRATRAALHQRGHAGRHTQIGDACNSRTALSGLEVERIPTLVRAEVVATTRSKQVPRSNSSLLGEVYLAAK